MLERCGSESRLMEGIVWKLDLLLVYWNEQELDISFYCIQL